MALHFLDTELTKNDETALFKVTVNVWDTKFGFRSLKAELLTESRLTIHHSMHKKMGILTILKLLANTVK